MQNKKISIKVATGTGLIAIFIYIIVLSIFKNKITAELTLSYFGTMLTAIVTIFGVMWQIEKNNEKIDEEKKKEENKSKRNLYLYINHVLEYNVKKFGDLEKKEVSLDIMKHIFVSIRKNKVELASDWFRLFDKEILNNNIESILELPNSLELFTLASRMEKFNTFINKSFIQFDIFELVKHFRTIMIENNNENKNFWFLETIINELSIISILIFSYGSRDGHIKGLEKITIENIINIKKKNPQNVLMLKVMENLNLLKMYQSLSEKRKKLDSPEWNCPILEVYIESLFFVKEFIDQSTDFIDFKNISNDDVEGLSNLILFEINNVNKFVEESKRISKELTSVYKEIIAILSQYTKQQDS